MKQVLIPPKGRVVIRRAEPEETKRGGIIIPDTAKEKPQEGIVVSGSSTFYKKGERVLMSKYTGSEIKIDGEELLIVPENELLGILRNEE